MPKFVIPKRHFLWSDCLQRAMMRVGQRQIMGCCLTKEKKGSAFFIFAIAHKRKCGIKAKFSSYIKLYSTINSANLIAFSPAVLICNVLNVYIGLYLPLQCR